MSLLILRSYNFTPKELIPFLFQKFNCFRLRRRHPWESVRVCVCGGGVGDDIIVDDVIERFKEKNGWRCLARARTNMQNTNIS